MITYRAGGAGQHWRGHLFPPAAQDFENGSRLPCGPGSPEAGARGRRFVSLERKMYVFASIMMHIEATKRIASMGWPWDSTLERLQCELQNLCSVYGIPASSQCEYAPQLKPLEALILSNVKTGGCGVLNHYFPRATRETGKVRNCQ